MIATPDEPIGVIGPGHLASFLIRGWRRSGVEGAAILVSPRGRSRDLAAAHGVRVAADNAEIVARCSRVVLAVRPKRALTAVAGLPWRAGQLLLSVCAGVPCAALADAAAPADVARAMPISAAAIGASATTLFPEHAGAQALLAPLGPVTTVGGETSFDAATISAAVYVWAHELIRLSAEWSETRGLAPAEARALSAAVFEAAAAMIREPAHVERTIEAMIADLATQGGISEVGLAILREGGIDALWRAACDGAEARMRGRQVDAV